MILTRSQGTSRLLNMQAFLYVFFSILLFFCYMVFCDFSNASLFYSGVLPGVQMTVSLIKFPGLFFVFLRIFAVMRSGTVLILPRISNSPSLFFRFFGIVPWTLTIIGITVTFTYQRFFSSLARYRELSHFRFSFMKLCRQIGHVFLMNITKFGLLRGIKLYIF